MNDCDAYSATCPTPTYTPIPTTTPLPDTGAPVSAAFTAAVLLIVVGTILLVAAIGLALMRRRRGAH